MKIAFVALLSVSLLSAASKSQAAVYEWVDDKGVVHFTDNADKIPAKYLNKVRESDGTKGAVTFTPSAVSPSGQPDPNSRVTAGRLPAAEDERAWRSRFRSLREEKKQIESGLAAKREKSVKLRRKKAIYGRGSDRTAFNEQNSDIERDEARIKVLEQGLRDLDVEAGRAGVPMEWRQ